MLHDCSLVHILHEALLLWFACPVLLFIVLDIPILLFLLLLSLLVLLPQVLLRVLGVAATLVPQLIQREVPLKNANKSIFFSFFNNKTFFLILYYNSFLKNGEPEVPCEAANLKIIVRQSSFLCVQLYTYFNPFMTMCWFSNI